MNPGRVFWGVGSGEALNEVPLGMAWPSGAEQLARMEEALEIIGRLLAGERVDFAGEHFRTDGAYLYTRPERRPPVYVSAFHRGSARAAGRLGDGVWTLADPEQAPPVIAAYRKAAEEAGREPGEVLIQVSFSYAPTDEEAFRSAVEWKATMVDDYYVEDWHDPAAMQRRARDEISDDEFRTSFILSADPDEHVERIRKIEKLGATTVVLMNVSGADPHEAIRFYGERVLPQLRS